MRKLFCFLFLLVCLSTVNAQSAYDITGVITDEKDMPIPGATIFLGDSRKATASDADGKFILRQVQPGKYNVVVKMLGYAVTTHEFILQNKDVKFRFKLAENNLLLNTANISAISRSDREWYLDIFTRCFFGVSNSARDCKIENPDIIRFHYDKQNSVLTASTDDFLIIENKALGYRIKYLLTNFSYDNGHAGGVVAFTGRLFFEDMQGDGQQLKKWEQARADVYLGSITHFFRALFNSKTDENKFVIYQVPDERLLNAYAKKHKQIPQRYYKPVKLLDKFITTTNNGFKLFDLRPLIADSTELYVLYTPKREPKDFMAHGVEITRGFKMPLGQLSFLRPVRDSILINKNGDVSPAANLIKGGFWTWGQMAAFVPSDYQLPPEFEPARLKRFGRGEARRNNQNE
ncbi:carboxypeptidase-like regulatory domain-containing protein [Mucilaginibacter calamicampi]|uniref:Carboxypeptidase-like regulatory domain-containing protein n=1 Tax=Mucilaginibacter calamicampi TaxID=1302352 RepID=A0ABW2YQF0_9SPHI